MFYIENDAHCYFVVIHGFFSMLSLIAKALYAFYPGIVDPFIFIRSLSRLFSSAKGYCVYKITKIIQGCLQIWNFSCCVQLEISLVSYRV